MSEIENLKISAIKDAGAAVTALRLHQLISSLCSLFQIILFDVSQSERRVFSFALSDRVDDEVASVLQLGVKYSYLQRTSIGRKEGFGRTERYILTRRLAPMFNLDPNGFSGYKFLLNEELRQMMIYPDAYRKKLRRLHRKSDPSLQAELLFTTEDASDD